MVTTSARLVSGGRYDRLIGQFGYPCAATGFSFDLERVLGALRTAEVLPKVSGPDVLLIDFSPDKSVAHRLARLLRERGFAVARDIINRELAGSLDYARASAIRRAVILGSIEQPPETVLVHDLTTEIRHALPLEAFERAVSQGDFTWPT